jgi:hypothetical protein
LALAAPFGAHAQTVNTPPADISSLRQEIEAMRASYEARLQALERRLQAAESTQAAQPSTTNAGRAAAAATADTSPAPSQSAPPAVAAAGNANSFNPAISLILSGGYQRTSQDPANYRISGIQLPTGSEAGPGSRGFSLAESELGLSASIDPWLRGATAISLHADNTLSVEEAYIQTTGLDHGLSLKAGRFFSGIGYLNSQHAHTWDFVDNPLAYQAFLGTQYGDDGVQLRWLAPTDQYIELGAELGRGRSFPGSDSGRNGAGMAALTAHTGGDIGTSHNWRAGLSMLNAKADAQSLAGLNAAGNATVNTFTGSTRVWVADAVWKWAPNGNATRTNFKLQGEYLHSQRTGNLTYDLPGANSTGSYSAAQSGWYVQAVYQFMPSWRVGVRTERLSPGSPDYGVNAASFTNTGYQAKKNSLMIDFSPSEFSRFRLQLARDRSQQGLTDNQIFLQYQMSLGAHGGHSY